MKVSRRGQVTIPKKLRDQYGFRNDVEVEFKPVSDGLLIGKRDVDDKSQPREELTARSRRMMETMEERKKAGLTGVDVVAGILGKNALGEGVTVDEYIEEIRGR